MGVVEGCDMPPCARGHRRSRRTATLAWLAWRVARGHGESSGTSQGRAASLHAHGRVPGSMVRAGIVVDEPQDCQRHLRRRPAARAVDHHGEVHGPRHTLCSLFALSLKRFP